MTPAMRKQARAWRASGKSVRAIAIDLDVTRQTVYRALDDGKSAA